MGIAETSSICTNNLYALPSSITHSSILPPTPTLMLKIGNLSVEVDKKTILEKVSMRFDLGKNYCIIGKNWSGKSSLAMAIMGHPKYSITDWELNIENWKLEIDLLGLDPNERAKLGIFVAFQHIPEIKGIKLFEFLKSIYDAKHDTASTFLSFKKIVEPIVHELGIPMDFLRRDLNVWFSGGERRKIEILQLELLQPKYIFLDEIDSGLDVDAFRSVVKMISQLNHENNTFIIITHIFDIIEHIPIDKVYVMSQGKVVEEGDQEVIQRVKENGFSQQNL